GPFLETAMFHQPDDDWRIPWLLLKRFDQVANDHFFGAFFFAGTFAAAARRSASSSFRVSLAMSSRSKFRSHSSRSMCSINSSRMNAARSESVFAFSAHV